MRRRGRGGAAYPDLSDLKALMDDGKAHAEVGLVAKPDSGPHWRKVTGRNGRTDILVEVETAPRGHDLTCRLACAAGGPAMGLWRVPAIGTEVLVVIPDGEIEFMPTIAAVLSSGSVPARASDQRTVLVAPDVIEVQAPSVVIGPDPTSPTQGVLVAQDSVKLGGSSAFQPIMLGDLEVAAINAFAAALGVYVAGIKPVADPSNAFTPAIGTAITALSTALLAAKSTVSKTR